MRVAVAGGTGVVGRHVVQALLSAGHEAVVLARSLGVDVAAGNGVDDAVAGAGAVIDVSNLTTMSKRKSLSFFTAGTQHLLAAGERAGVRHHVALSIVGVDRVNLGYYEGKRRQEELVLAAPVPSSVLRATQFHEFAGQVLAQGRGPLAVVPRMRIQPVAAREVAEALVALVSGPAVGYASEMAGPKEEQLVEMAGQLLQARGQRRLLLPLRLPGQAGRAMIDGALVPAHPGPRGEQTFSDWLTTSRLGQESPGAP